MPNLAARYRTVRAATLQLVARLLPEDTVVQSMPDASPTKWHLAHTAWFFETFVLGPTPGYRPFDEAFAYLFNSYYEAVGARHARAARGLLSRPSLDEVLRYRRHVDEHMTALLERSPDAAVRGVVTLGLHHEQQHQELIVTDIKHAFWCNPLRPAYSDTPPASLARTSASAKSDEWCERPGGLVSIGHAGPGPDGEPFAFDNESPRHQVFLRPYALGRRLVTNAQFLAFIDDGGYRRADLWLSDAWQAVSAGGWEAPLYWERRDDRWWTMTLAGMQPVSPDESVCHVSLYEADAYARWAGARLPTEAEWEAAAASEPVAASPDDYFGDVWQWTQSAYTPYPGYQPAAGALGEYNGKFMCNQMVLRGGSCATPSTHIRATYRNFFPPSARWQFSGLRLARDA